AAAVRPVGWGLVPALVVRPFQRAPAHPRYSSCIRYGQIEAAAHNQYPFSSQPPDENHHDDDNGTMISEGLSWARSNPLLRPDVLHDFGLNNNKTRTRSEEHTSELQSRFDLVCRLLLEKKKK